MTAFEMKWNPKKERVTFPKAFLEGYDISKTVAVTPENYLDWLR